MTLTDLSLVKYSFENTRPGKFLVSARMVKVEISDINIKGEISAPKKHFSTSNLNNSYG